MWRFDLIAIILAVIVFGLVFSVECLPPNEQQGRANEHGQTADAGAKPGIGPVDSQAPEAPQQSPSDPPCGILSRVLNSSGAADWTLVLVGVTTAILAIRTLRALQRQVKANVDAANAAKDSARTQSEVAVLQNRAYLTTRGWEVFRVIDKVPDALVTDRDCRVTFYLKNRGRSTAKLMNIKKVVPSAGVNRNEVLDVYLDPGEWVEQWIELTLPKSHEQSMAILSRPLIVSIAVEYSDSFGHRTKRFSKGTISHTEALTAGPSPAKQEWLVNGGTALNDEIEHPKPAGS